MKITTFFVACLLLFTACDKTSEPTKTGMTDSKTTPATNAKYSLLTLDPGHFHAALVQKSMNDLVSPTVHVYAPDGFDLNEHLKRIEGFNSRKENPTKWDTKVYKGTDSVEKMLSEKAGNVVVLAGNNQHKIDQIEKSVNAGLNVLADKPMAIDEAGYDKLKAAFETAKTK